MQILKNPKRNLSGLCMLLLCMQTLSLAVQKTATSDKVMVVAPTEEAVEAGLAILRQGGNAVDAAAASAFALMVTDPAMCSLGGRSQILLRLKDGQVIGIDGATQAPGFLFEPARTGHGYKTCPVPGSPAAIEKMALEYGTLNLKQILQPAIGLAKKGFIVNEELAAAIKANEEKLRLYPGTVRHFFKEDGSCYDPGDKIVQPTLARTLEIIADQGSEPFYKGPLADIIVQDMENHSGLIRAQDLHDYKVFKGDVVEGCYFEYKIISRGGACDGASVIEILHILEKCDLKKYTVTDPKYLHILAQALYIGQADELLPDWQQTSRELALRRFREIDPDKALPIPIKPVKKEGGTNHLSVIDSEGNVVSLTQSIGPTFGSKVVNPDLGFFYAYSYDMNDEPVPFQREKTSQSPTILLKEQKPYLVLGSAGSSRIVSSIVQTIVNVIDHGMSLEEAVSHPRVCLYEEELRLESFHLPSSALDRLREMGYKLRLYKELNGWFGKVHALLVGPYIMGAADPRDFGAAKGF